ncbi:YeeE/YedE family protein [Cyanobium sp. CH-040]|uniref:YeeE/YedE family protein n=1 Tax=Cyanobium sp. CH-040 TaxID=2823708 RepID=UPI0020CC33CC|nr:YeeE/YedE family protein [Cyanobium sp. CH-040]MCP9926284.1 YeeE/YedE family protein [Cyanobium sp. CH-040]
MNRLLAFLAGLLFGFGLLLSGMANPAKVLAFLDLAGPWDPSLALVMVGAIATALPAFQLARRRDRSLLGAPMQLPERRSLDRRLVVGSLVFGVGWGLAGFCPGPALTVLLTGHGKVLVFVAFLLLGMGLFERLEASTSQRSGGRR